MRSEACYFCGNHCWVGCPSPVFIRILLLPSWSANGKHHPPLATGGCRLAWPLPSFSLCHPFPPYLILHTHSIQSHLLNKSIRSHYSLDSTLQRLPAMQTPSCDIHGPASLRAQPSLHSHSSPSSHGPRHTGLLSVPTSGPCACCSLSLEGFSSSTSPFFGN